MKMEEQNAQEMENIIAALDSDSMLSWCAAEEKLAEIWGNDKQSSEKVASLSAHVWMTRGDFHRLHSFEWLNDSIINSFLVLCKDWCEKQGKKIHFFSSYFYSIYEKHDYKHANLERWTRNVKLFEMDKIIIPIHLGVHWSLAVINIKEKRLEYRDSLSSSITGNRIITNLAKYIYDEHKRHYGKELDLSEWSKLIFIAEEIAQQNDTNACGIYTCEFIRAIVQDREFNTQIEEWNHQDIRRRLACEILTKKMLSYANTTKLKGTLTGLTRENLISSIANLQKYRKEESSILFHKMKQRINELLETDVFI
jgi:sentrin-specific protease 1